MPTVVQFRRGTTAQNDLFTGAVGEVSFDITTTELRVHDGSTAGGYVVANKDYVDAAIAEIVTFDGDYNNLSNLPTLGTASSQDVGYFATAAQGALADTAIQSGDLSAVAISGDYDDLLNVPSIPTLENVFGTLVVSDTDSGFTWAETGSIVADTVNDTFTVVSGTGINVDADATNDAIRITNTGVTAIAGTANQVLVTGSTGSITVSTPQDIATTSSPTFSALTISNQINFTPIATPTNAEGRVYYDSTEKTLVVCHGSDSATSLGQEIAPICRNTSGTALLNGTVVVVTGATGQTPNIGKAIASSAHISILGVCTEDINNNDFGRVTTFGTVRNIDTSTWAEGTMLYLSDSVAGAFTDVQPTHPNFSICIATVTYSHATQGTIFVKTDTHWIHNLVEDLSPTLATTLDADDNYIQNLATPVLDTDAANKAYVDSNVYTPPTLQTISYAATITPDFSAGHDFKITLTDNVQLNAPINASPGDSIKIAFKQGGTGSYTLTLGTNVVESDGLDYTLSTAVGSVDRIIMTLDEFGSGVWSIDGIARISA